MIIHLPGILNIIVDILAWLLIHVSVSLSIDKLPTDSFNPISWLYRERQWEKGGRIYQTVLRIKQWKGLLPDGAAILKNRFRKKHLGNPDEAYISRFIAETCRAELIHWGIFIFSPLFFIWNEWWIGLIMIAYGCAVNVPCIVTQRYNRIRLKRINNKIIKRHSIT
jgi:glycosyl-4,4'-diaponeurosporenoate acyltransferase